MLQQLYNLVQGNNTAISQENENEPPMSLNPVIELFQLFKLIDLIRSETRILNHIRIFEQGTNVPPVHSDLLWLNSTQNVWTNNIDILLTFLLIVTTWVSHLRSFCDQTTESWFGTANKREQSLTNFKAWIRRRVSHKAYSAGLGIWWTWAELVSDKPIKVVIKIPP